MSEEEILESPMLNYPLTQYMFCSPDEGAAAVVLCHAERRAQVHRQADLPAGDDGAHPAPRRVRGAQPLAARASRPVAPTVDASRAAYEMAGIGPEDVDVIQLQDTDAGAEIIHLAENGFCADGEQEQLSPRARPRSAGSLPMNTDGGLIANGEPIGASGLRQVHEIVLQLRGQAGERQVPDSPTVGYTPALRRTGNSWRVHPDRVT